MKNKNNTSHSDNATTNTDNATQALKILSNEQIDFIKQRLDTGGKR